MYPDTKAVTGTNIQATEDVRHKSLTPREWEFLELLAKGLSNEKIAVELVVKKRTIEGKVVLVYEKLGLSNKADFSFRVQAALWYWGITTNSIRNGST